MHARSSLASHSERKHSSHGTHTTHTTTTLQHPVAPGRAAAQPAASSQQKPSGMLVSSRLLCQKRAGGTSMQLRGRCEPRGWRSNSHPSPPRSVCEGRAGRVRGRQGGHARQPCGVATQLLLHTPVCTGCASVPVLQGKQMGLRAQRLVPRGPSLFCAASHCLLQPAHCALLRLPHGLLLLLAAAASHTECSASSPPPAPPAPPIRHCCYVRAIRTASALQRRANWQLASPHGGARGPRGRAPRAHRQP